MSYDVRVCYMALLWIRYKIEKAGRKLVVSGKGGEEVIRWSRSSIESDPWQFIYDHTTTKAERQ